MPNYNWSQLTSQQLGRYGEYCVKMEFASYGMANFSPEVDDAGIDFVVRTPAKHYYEVQVKSIRDKTGYIFAQKSKFDATQGSLYMAVVKFKDNYQPRTYLIPQQLLQTQTPNDFSRDMDYVEGVLIWVRKTNTRTVLAMTYVESKGRGGYNCNPTLLLHLIH